MDANISTCVEGMYILPLTEEDKQNNIVMKYQKGGSIMKIASDSLLSSQEEINKRLENIAQIGVRNNRRKMMQNV